MTTAEVIALAASLLASLLAAALIGLVRWVRRQFDPIVKQLTPNGGASALDKINALHDEFMDHKRDTTKRFDDVQTHLYRQDQRIDGLYRPDKDVIR